MSTINIAIALQIGQSLNSYTLNFRDTGGIAMTSSTGRLPNGIAISFEGGTTGVIVLSGTCQDLPGSYPLTLWDNLLSTNVTVVTFTVSPANPLAAPVISCLGATPGSPNTLTLAAGPVAMLFTATNEGSNWSLSSNASLGIDGSGKVAGTLNPGIYSVVVQCNNAAYTDGPTQPATYTLALTITPAIPVVAINDPGALNVNAGSAVNAGFNVQAVSGHVTWSATGLPNGCSINPTSGQVIGTTQIAGTYAATITATNATGSGSFVANFVVASPAGSNAPSFAFLAVDSSLTAVEIDIQTGAVTCARTTPFKFGELARFALIFLQASAPATPPAAATTKIGFCKNNDFGGDYVFPPPTVSLVESTETAPAYLLAEVPLIGDAIEKELRNLIDTQGDTKFTVMSDVCWKVEDNPRASGTFTFDVQPAVTSY